MSTNRKTNCRTNENHSEKDLTWKGTRDRRQIENVGFLSTHIATLHEAVASVPVSSERLLTSLAVQQFIPTMTS
jgi:hypothetical protein